MEKRKYKVIAMDQNGDIWIVATDIKETAEHLADRFRQDGYTDVHITEHY